MSATLYTVLGLLLLKCKLVPYLNQNCPGFTSDTATCVVLVFRQHLKTLAAIKLPSPQIDVNSALSHSQCLFGDSLNKLRCRTRHVHVLC